MDDPREDPGTLRLGVVSYLNALPLVRGLGAAPEVTLISDPPAIAARKLAAGEVDVGLVPVVELLRHPELVTVSDACVGALGPVDSVLLLLRKPPEEVSSLVLDPHSGTSQVLAQLVFRDLFGRHPQVRIADPATAWADGADDAVLMIGDPALRVFHEGAPTLDLAEAWRRMTDLPFVFAVWAGRRDLVVRHPALAGLLERARDRGCQELQAIAEEEAAGAGLSAGVVRVYLEDRIRYRLAASDRAGLDRFLELARPFVHGAENDDPCSTSSSSASTQTR
ncbi:MAG: hypothetical protein CMJ83_13350 [Planctomycetes bacterium]|nr:hypothetical protein [Planctomycetota bacterium]